MNITLKERIYQIVEAQDSGGVVSKAFSIFIITLIILNVLAVSLETVERLYNVYAAYFRGFEVFSVIVFTVEYIMRIWSCTSSEKYRRPIVGRIRYALKPLTIVDLIAILPFYLPMLIPFDLRFIRILRLFRMLRIFKVGRYYQALGIIWIVLKEKKEELLITFSVGFIFLVIASSLIYFAEHEAQPEIFSSIPAAMWWGVITLTTVGYGDAYPVTTLGKLLGAAISLLGIGMFALPAGILASGFSEKLREKREQDGLGGRETR